MAILRTEAATAHQDRRRYYIACLLAFCLAAVSITLIVRIDNTNLGTTNGLWKAPDVHAWEAGTGRPSDSGGLLYMPVYGLLSRWIPDRAVSYGVHTQFVTYRKMAILNAMFGAMASGVVFLFALSFVPSLSAAFLVFLAHACAGFVILNSLNSEDVMPAYAFFTLATAFFFRHVFTHNTRPLAGCAFFMTLTTLFHWTLMIPGLGALAGAQLLLVLQKRSGARRLILFPLLFLGLIQAWAIALHIALHLWRNWSVLPILYPAKASPTGWTGFGWNKVAYAIIGIGNYFSGAQNVTNYVTVWQDPTILVTIGASWLFLGVTLGACSWALFARHGQDHIRVLAGYGLALFLTGELEHLYSQPQDPQSQIQPMFVGVVGFIIILYRVRTRWTNVGLRILAAALVIAFLFNGFWNVKLMYASRGYDSESVKAVSELAELFPPSSTVVVSHGFEGWNTWWYVTEYGGDRSYYLSKNTHLSAAFTNHPGISAQAAADLIERQIGDAFHAGYQVVAAGLWTQSREDFIGSLTTIVDRETARGFDDLLRNRFRLGRTWDTQVGRFVELRPFQLSP